MTAHIRWIILVGGTTSVIDFLVIKMLCTRQFFKRPSLCFSEKVNDFLPDGITTFSPYG